ncbi:MAG: L,D-transpeptidase family protein [Rhodomicrobium sp.]
MVLRSTLAVTIVLAAALGVQTLRAEQAPTTETPSTVTPKASAPAKAADEATSRKDEAAPSKETAPRPATPEADALRKAVSTLPSGKPEAERNEHAAISSFYAARDYAPFWMSPAGSPSPKALLVAAEIGRAGEWGLDPNDFPLPNTSEPGTGATPSPSPEAIAADEIKFSLAVLKYARYARGGRIQDPSGQLSSNLDRTPEFIKPETVLEGIAAADQPDAYLRGLNPAQPQFERLRQKYLTLLKQSKQRTAEAKRLLANMEEWRWMPAGMGAFYIWNNIPDFTQRVVKDGKIIREVRIVAGEVDKQTPIFSKPLRKIVLKPTWTVPDSVKVHELLPDMLNGGQMMREYALQVYTKDGQLINWRRVDWSSEDITDFEVVQPYNSMSVMGKVKFSFPNKHIVYMHDFLQQDKWMFSKKRRTYSHGCMRVANPIGLAELVLREDKGWDSKRVVELLNTSPPNHEIDLDRNIPVHMTYFTALVDDDGKLHTFPDVYGHERRITLALEGKWRQINKGRDQPPSAETYTDRRWARRYAGDDSDSPPEWGDRPLYPSRPGFFSSLFGE